MPAIGRPAAGAACGRRRRAAGAGENQPHHALRVIERDHARGSRTHGVAHQRGLGDLLCIHERQQIVGEIGAGDA